MLMRRTSSRGRRAGGGPAEAIARIRKQWPQAWADVSLRHDFFAHALPLYGFRVQPLEPDRPLEDSTQRNIDVMAQRGASRQDVMLPWIFREVLWVRSSEQYNLLAQQHPRGLVKPEVQKRFFRLLKVPDKFTLLLQAHLRREGFVALRSIRDWVVAARPDLLRLNAAEAHLKAREWHEALEVKTGQKALQKAAARFAVLKRWPDGYWLGLAPDAVALLAIGKALAHCYGSLGTAESYQMHNFMLVLFDRKNMPHATIAAERESDGTYAAQEIRGKGNVLPVKKYLLYVADILAAADHMREPSIIFNRLNCRGRVLSIEANENPNWEDEGGNAYLLWDEAGDVVAEGDDEDELFAEAWAAHLHPYLAGWLEEKLEGSPA